MELRDCALTKSERADALAELVRLTAAQAELDRAFAGELAEDAADERSQAAPPERSISDPEH